MSTTNKKLKDESIHNINHKEETTSILKKSFSNGLKRKSEDELEKPSKIINRGILKNPEVTQTFTSTDINNIYQCLYRSRRSSYPKLPTNLNEVIDVMSERQIKTVQDENFVLVVNSDNKIICFSTKSNLKLLCSVDKIFVDGTFTYCAKYFLQLFTIHIFKNGHYVPLVYFLLPDKCKDTYARSFGYVIEKCSEINLSFSPSKIVSDFEEAIHIGAKTIWPEIQIVGCRFHLTQNWWKHIQNLGLSKEYKDESSEIGNWLKLVFGLPLLNSEEVSDCFATDLMSIAPDDERVGKFCDYLVEYYIDEGAKFNPHIWASREITSERTTNSCESYHSKFNSQFTKAHPNIFIFTHVLNTKIQTDTYMLINGININTISKNSAFNKKKQNIKNLSNDLNDNKISKFTYLKHVSKYYQK
ncbi:uncharacterized protein LOC107882945 [Acyrthosiphon pisum]|uniref:MULE transposase domain-containing protein n=1 Tax=Acyrthosiphon pisum TaxID=7029 RepID=A0A8R2D2B4_ACYPI|nr:uncharacterized protein LOC107882945 [Acyrthosiphon pisum]|eukprot:XP_016657607.1 PREDICTED: uncharacterized protein LOC107882945 [Acyrthosiphon pisum]